MKDQQEKAPTNLDPKQLAWEAFMAGRCNDDVTDYEEFLVWYNKKWLIKVQEQREISKDEIISAIRKGNDISEVADNVMELYDSQQQPTAGTNKARVLAVEVPEDSVSSRSLL